jgi:putative two-component system hydrogenase maturation factor HypX/HoxX
VCRATADGAVWISHLKRPGGFKLPAAQLLPFDVPEQGNWSEIRYEERDGVGYLHFDFYNGAMSTEQCLRLREAYRHATRRPTAVIVLMGGRDFFSNGIHLNVIEAAEDPATESWWNLHAIDDLVREIVETDSHLVISALAGDAAAGGVPFALAADHVVAREDVVLNPYYRHMGGLYGSEYWTYLMPRRIGHDLTEELTSAPFEPIGTRRAVEIGLLDDAFGEDVPRFRGQVRALATELAGLAYLPTLLEAKRSARQRDEQIKPLSTYRTEELAKSHECFFGPDRSYHEARHRFVRKLGAPCVVTPAQPRSRRQAARGPAPSTSARRASVR